MTRINAKIPVSLLCDKHLLAETREIVRIPNQVKRGKLSSIGQPKHFTLGTGHVKFFRDKLLYIHKRYIDLYNECLNRGFNVKNMTSSFDDVPKELYNDWETDGVEESRIQELLLDRIIERMPKNAKHTKIK